MSAAVVHRKQPSPGFVAPGSTLMHTSDSAPSQRWASFFAGNAGRTDCQAPDASAACPSGAAGAQLHANESRTCWPAQSEQIADADEDTPWRTATSSGKPGMTQSAPDAPATGSAAACAAAPRPPEPPSWLEHIDAQVPRQHGRPLFGRRLLAHSLTESEFDAALQEQLPRDTTHSSSEPEPQLPSGGAQDIRQQGARAARSRAQRLHASAGLFPHQLEERCRAVPQPADGRASRHAPNSARAWPPQHPDATSDSSDGRFQAVLQQMHDDLPGNHSAWPVALPQASHARSTADARKHQHGGVPGIETPSAPVPRICCTSTCQISAARRSMSRGRSCRASSSSSSM